MNDDPFPAVEPAATHSTANPTDPSSYKPEPVAFTQEDIVKANKMAKQGLILTVIPPTGTLGLVMCFIANSKLKKYNQNTSTAKVGIVIGIILQVIIGVFVGVPLILYLKVVIGYGNS